MSNPCPLCRPFTFILVFFFASAVILTAATEPLIIMPVGDSITRGQDDEQGYGYRDNLSAKLQSTGVQFQYVGNSDPQYPGWFRDGAKINDFNAGGDHDIAVALRDYTPNTLLIHLGTNDLNSSSPEVVRDRMQSLLQYMFQLPEWSNVQRVLLCKIIPRVVNNAVDANVEVFNNLLQQMVEGQPDNDADWSKISLVDMYHAIEVNADMPPEDDPGLDLHPNASGYEKMATQFARALLAVTDDFERADGPLGSDWSADPSLVIQNGNLHNSSDELSWKYLAVYKSLPNPTEVQIQWAAEGDGCDSTGVEQSGIAFTDSDTSVANGYFIYYRSEYNEIRLWKIENGELKSSGEIESKASNSTAPVPGSTFKVIFNKADYSFQVFVDNVSAGTLYDAAKTFPLNTVYGGVMLKGGANNDIESFTVNSSPDNDTTPPAAVDDLTWTDKTATSVTLQWTAPANDGNDAGSGAASHYDLRQSTSPIDASNFDSASQVSNVPTPSAPGTVETFAVNGLTPETEYWFALKVQDAAGNTSLISNIISVTTDAQSDTLVPTCDDFEREQLGTSSWDAAPEQYLDAGDLTVQSGTSGWNYLAVYRRPGVAENPRQVAITFSPTKSSNSQYGFLTAGIAVLLDDTTSFANGYFILRRTDEIQLWRISQGKKDGSSTVVPVVGTTLPAPQPGDELKVAITEMAAGQFQFDLYINDQYDGTLNLQDGQYTPPDTWYAGIMQFGGDNNQIDKFCVYQPRSTQVIPYAIEEFYAPQPPSGKILQTLPDSLAVRVTNESGAPVPDAVVDFSVQQGQADLSVDDQDFDIIWKEVESGYLIWPMQTESDANASGNAYAAVPSTLENSNGRGKSVMTVWLPRQANCSFYARVIAPSVDENSLYIKIDDADSIEVKFRSTWTNWQWKMLAKRTLAAGTHKITLINRESGTRMDKLALVDSDKLPQYQDNESAFNSDFNKGGSGPRFTNVTDSSGVAYTFVTFGSDADTNVIVHAGGTKTDDSPLEGSPVVFELDPLPMPARTLASLPFPPDTLRGTVETVLADSFVVVARDTFLNFVPDVPIEWNLVQGTGGELVYQQSATDAGGKARCLLKMGSETLYKVVATSSLLPGQQAEFYARVDKLPGRMERIAGPSGQYRAGSVPGDTCVVRVYDKENNPYPSFPVQFVADGSGLVRAANETADDWKQSVRVYTDANGYARVLWQLGCEIGAQNLQAQASVPQGSPVVFQVQAVTGEPAAMVYASEDSTSGPIGMDVEPFVVQIADSCGNPVSGVVVEFRIIRGTNAYLNGVPGKIVARDTTSEEGLARAMLTLGMADNEVNVVRATAIGQNFAPLEFKALATGVAPARLIYVSGDEQDTTVTNPLPKPFKVRVLDGRGEGYAGHEVTFVLESSATGGVFNNNNQSEYSAMTDADGYATALLRLGTKAGIYIVKAISTHKDRPEQPLENSPVTFEANGLPDKAFSLAKVDSTDGQQATVNTTLEDPITVIVKDQFGNPVPGQTVTFRVSGAGGMLYDHAGENVEKTVQSDAAGLAGVVWKLPKKIGQWQVQVTSQMAQGAVTETFTATALAGPAYTMSAVHDTLYGRVGQPLTDSVRVHVVDEFGNPVRQQNVLFQLEDSEDGAINNDVAPVQVMTTDSGYAAVQWKLGTRSGVQTLKVSSNVLDENSSNLTIYAVAHPGNAKVMAVDARSRGQSGTVGRVLDQPMRIQVQDQFANGVADAPVFFKVIKGGGKIAVDSTKSFSDTLSVKTDEQGWAQVLWQLGGVVGSRKHALFVRAMFNGVQLTNSPDTLFASALAGPPDSLLLVSGDSLRGKVGNRLPEELTVKVVDAFSNPSYHHRVRFKAERTAAGIGFFNNDSSRKEIDVFTDDQGKASVKFTLGLKSGEYLVRAYSENNGLQLFGSPRTFKIFADPSSADSIAVDGTSTFTDTVGKWIETPLRVVALDSLGNPVRDGQPITFTIEKGGGHLGGSPSIDSTTVTDTTVYTDADGVARVYWQLGTRIGQADANVVRVTANSGTGPLKGSGLAFFAVAVADLPDPDSSSVHAFPSTALKANGRDSSVIVVQLRDKYNNPVAGVSVDLQEKPSDLKVKVADPEQNTDATGKTRGSVRSGKAGWIRIYAKDTDHRIEVRKPARVYFSPGEVSGLSIINGNNLRANIGTLLEQPLQVKVSDANGNGVPDVPVTFKVSDGGGKLYEDGVLKDSLKVLSDSSGVAAVRFVLGTDGPDNYIEANVGGKFGTIIKVKGNPNPTPLALRVKSGQYLSAAPGDTLPERIRVEVIDQDSLPIWGKVVRFESIVNNGSVTPSADTTDMFGVATTKARVGTAVGLNKFKASLADQSNLFVYIVDTTKVLPGVAARVVPWEGTEKKQKGIVGHKLPPFFAQAVDEYGNVVQDIAITFFIDENNDAFLNDSLKKVTLSTAELGYARVWLTLDTLAGPNIIYGFAPGTDTTKLFVGYGLADRPARMVKPTRGSGDRQTYEMGRMLPLPITALVMDKYGNPAPGGDVTFKIKDGGGMLFRLQSNAPQNQVVVKSDSNGCARVRWQLGNSVDNSVMASPVFVDQEPINFAATGDENKYPQFDAPNELANHLDYWMYEGNTLTFQVHATDADDDPITYRALRLPPGATFDATGTQLFSWTPTYDQGGRPDSLYYAVFEATDAPKSGWVRDSVRIFVRNATPITILSATPAENWEQLNVAASDTVQFCLQLNNPENLPVQFRWELSNDETSATITTTTQEPCYELAGPAIAQGFYHLTVQVLVQGAVVANHSWNMRIKVAVELSLFQCHVRPYEGVVLEWQTASEAGNLGFNVLRSLSENGPYQTINEKLIPARPDGKYRFTDNDVQAGQHYYYKIEDVSGFGDRTQHGPVAAEIAVPEKFDLAQNYPNPFNPSTTIRYQLPEATKVRLEVFNILGQVVRTLVDEQRRAGYHTVVWDGRNDAGSRVGSGVYYYRLQADGRVMVKKMALLK